MPLTAALSLGLLWLATTGLVACSTFSRAREQNLREVQEGMKTKDLIEAIGEPDEVNKTGATERWYYKIISADNRENYPYTAVVENDVVTQWFFDTARSDRAKSSPSGDSAHRP